MGAITQNQTQSQNRCDLLYNKLYCKLCYVNFTPKSVAVEPPSYLYSPSIELDKISGLKLAKNSQTASHFTSWAFSPPHIFEMPGKENETIG